MKRSRLKKNLEAAKHPATVPDRAPSNRGFKPLIMAIANGAPLDEEAIIGDPGALVDDCPLCELMGRAYEHERPIDGDEYERTMEQVRRSGLATFLWPS